MAGGRPGGERALLAAALRAGARPATTQEVEFTAKYSRSGTATSSAAASACAPRSTITDPAAPAPLQLTNTTAALPEGRGRERPLLPEVQPRGAARPRPARLPAGARSSARARRIGAAPADRRQTVNTKVTLFNGTREGREPDDHHLRDPRPRPGDDAARACCAAAAGRRTATSSTSTVPPIKTLPSAPDASVTFFDATTRDLTVRAARAHDPLHRQPGAVRRDVLPARRRSSPTRADDERRARALHARGGPRCP